MRKLTAIFLDDGGVIQDDARRAPQWQVLVGEFFAPRLGGEQASWAAANGVIFPETLRRFLARLEAWQDGDRYERQVEAYQVDWLRSICAAVGVEAPATDTACIELALAADAYVIPRVDAIIAGAADALAALGQDCALFTASGSTSVELGAYYAAYGIRDRFRRLYGPDLVQTPKNGPLYYERVFADAGIDPANAVVVDDSPRMVAYAVAAGARGVLVGGRPAPEGVPAVRSIAELPNLLEEVPSP